MAIVTSSPTRYVDALLIYVANDKADQRGERYVLASGLNGALPGAARHQYRDVRQHWGKDNRKFVEGYHVVESFGQDELDPNDPAMWQRAHELGRALAAERFPGRQVTVWTQRDGRTGCLHNHIVVNSIETATGRSMDSSLITHARLAEFHDRVLAEHGFEQREDLQDALQDAQDRRDRGEPSGLRRRSSRQQTELKQAHKYVEWEAESEIADELGVTRSPEPFSVDVLRYRIGELLDDPDVTDWDSFVKLGAEKHRLRVATRGKKGVVTYGLMREQADGSLAEPGGTDTRRSTYLGADEYGKSAVLDRVAAKRAQPSVAAVPAAPVAAAPVATSHTSTPEVVIDDAELDALMQATLTDEDREVLERLNARQPSSGPAVAVIPDDIVDPLEHPVDEQPVVEVPPAAVEPASAEPRPTEPAESPHAKRRGIDFPSPKEISRMMGYPSQEETDAYWKEQDAKAKVAARTADQAAESASAASTTSAPAPAVADSGERADVTTAPALVPTGGGYRSALRDVTPATDRHRELFPLVAGFDELAREALLRGERIDESTVPKGIGSRFLDALGDKLDPAVLEQLRMREAKKQTANKHYEAGKQANDELRTMKESAEKNGDLTGLWQGGSRAQELIAERKKQNRVCDRLRSEIAAGVYEELTPRASQATLDAVAQRSAAPDAERAAKAAQRSSGPSLG